MLDPRFVLLAFAINIAGSIAYARDTLYGNTRPNRVTWTLWTTVPLIIFLAQLGENVGWVSLLTLSSCLGPGIILLASFLNKKAYWKLTKFDLLCGLISVLALIFWLITKTGTVAIMLSITADFMAGLPTLIKAYRFPHTESTNAYLTAMISAVITLFTIQTWNFATYSFTVYMLLFTTVVYILIKWGQSKKHEPKPQA
jgi:hypothetical protein